jgi:hypothetical protein
MRFKRWVFLNIGLWASGGLMWFAGISTGRDLFTTLTTVAFTSLAYELFVVPRDARTRSVMVDHGRL